VIVWRIATEAEGYPAHDTSGAGAERDGGRWNPMGVPLLYASESRALACLETLVHLDDRLPLNRFLVELRIPEDAWERRTVFEKDGRAGWDAEPAGETSIVWGEDWAKKRASLVAVVPSVIVPEEDNVLINPMHEAIESVTSTTVRKWLFDLRLRKAK